MKKTVLKIVFMFMVASFMGLGFAVAGSYATNTMAEGGKIFNSMDITGAPVMDFHGDLLGIVDEVMVDSGGQAFAIVNQGDYGLTVPGSIRTPVPFQELRIYHEKTGKYTVAFKTETKQLDFSPYLDPLQMNSRQYEANIYEYYGVQPYWTRSGAAEKSGLMEFNSLNLVGAAVENSCGKIIGIVNGVMVDSGGQAFAVINHGDYDVYGENGVNTPVPFQEQRIYQGKGGQYTVVLRTDTEHLDFAPYLDPLQMNSRQYEASIYEYYGIQPYWTQTGG